MIVDKKLLLHLENLCKIHLLEGEREELLDDLEKMIQMVDKLRQLDIEKLSSQKGNPVTLSQLREDKPGQPLSPEQISLLNVDRESGYFRVPNVLRHQLRKGVE